MRDQGLRVLVPSLWDDCDQDSNCVPFKAIEAQPDLVWDLIESREFGLHTRQLRKDWISIMSIRGPDKILKHFAALPEEPSGAGDPPRDWAIQSALTGSFANDADPNLALEVMRQLVELSDGGDREKIVAIAAGTLKLWIPEERHLEFLRGASSPVAREIHLKAYAGHLQRYVDFRKLEKLDQIPADLRAEVLPLLRLPEPASDE